MCSFNCGVGESLQIGDHVRLQIREAERGQVWITIQWPPGRKKTMVEIISPCDEDGHTGSHIVAESTAGKRTLKPPFALVTGPGNRDSKNEIRT